MQRESRSIDPVAAAYAAMLVSSLGAAALASGVIVRLVAAASLRSLAANVSAVADKLDGPWAHLTGTRSNVRL